MNFNRKQILAVSTVLVLWSLCLLSHTGLAILLASFVGLLLSTYWLVVTRSVHAFVMTALMTLVTYVLSVPAVCATVILPYLADEFDKTPIKDLGNNQTIIERAAFIYITPCKPIVESKVGNELFESYYRYWIPIKSPE